jgi:hypothetical protein
MREGPSHQDLREAFQHDPGPHRAADFVDTIARPVAHRIADQVLPQHPHPRPPEITGEREPRWPRSNHENLRPATVHEPDDHRT